MIWRSVLNVKNATEKSSSRFISAPPFNIIIFGATGDLASRKLLPALFNRWCDGQVPKTSRIIGCSRSNLSHDAWLDIAKTACGHPDRQGEKLKKKWEEFTALLKYTPVDVRSPETDWSILKSYLNPKNKITVSYLATSPSLFVETAEKLSEHGFNSEGCRLVLEKPIGHDLQSAQHINAGISRYFSENQIFRIDHYLGKETVQNLMVLRFANTLLEPLWNRDSIDHVQITVAEDIGTEGRAGYYDSSGALRDMVQNHLLQLLCLTAMEPPASLESTDIRSEKIKVLRTLLTSSEQNGPPKTIRGQYGAGTIANQSVKGYCEELDSGTQSLTETFVALRAEIDNWRWSGVPFYLRTGKRMSFRRSEIVIAFKPVPHPIFEAANTHANHLVLRLQPDEGVKLYFHMKDPGPGGMRIRYVPLDLSYAESFSVKYPDAYERLLMEIFRGNLNLFMSREEVEAAWKWIDQIQQSWQREQTLPDLYRAGEDGPPSANTLIEADDRRWWHESAKTQV